MTALFQFPPEFWREPEKGRWVAGYCFDYDGEHLHYFYSCGGDHLTLEEVQVGAMKHGFRKDAWLRLLEEIQLKGAKN